jgi:hypothetical protein
MINAEFGLHELAIEPALHERQRPKPGPLPPRHLLLSACTVSLGPRPVSWWHARSRCSSPDHALITVRKDTGPRSCWQAALGLAGGKDVTGLGGAPAGGCHVHGGLGGAFGRARRNH